MLVTCYWGTILIFISGTAFNAVTEQLGWKVVVCQMKDGWRFVSLGSGKQFVITTGVKMKQGSFAGNLGTPHKVCCTALTVHQPE